MGARCSQRLWAGPQGLAPRRGSPTSSPHTSWGLCPPKHSSGGAIAQGSSAWTTQHVGAGGPENWKWAFKSFVQVLEKNFFFLLRFVKTLSSLLYPSAHPLLLTPQSFIAIFFKPGELDDPLKLKGELPHFTKQLSVRQLLLC